MEKRKKNIAQLVASALSGIVMIICILVYVILGITINFWHPGWLIIVGGALGTAIINIVTNLVVDIKELKEDEKENKLDKE